MFATRPYTTQRTPGRVQPRKKETLGTLLVRNPTSVLALLSLFVFAATAAFWHTNDMNFSATSGFRHSAEAVEAARNVTTDRNINRRFVMGGVKLGMTRHMIEQTHPDARVDHDRNGEAVLTVPTPNGMMVAWFYEHDEWLRVNGEFVNDPVDRVYRLRMDEAYNDMSENDLIARYAREYGRPIDTTCTRVALGDSPRCTYHWWGGDGIELKATVKQKVDINGQVYTLMTTVATDTVKSTSMDTASLSDVSGSHRWGYVE